MIAPHRNDTAMARKYGLASYDDHFCLKPPALLWIAVLYLSRAFVLLMASDLGSVSRMRPEAVAMLRAAINPYTLIPSLVAAPVLYALFARGPSSTKLVRWIWAHGRSMLVLAAALDCALSVIGSRLLGGDVADLAPGPLVVALFDVYFLVYILATPRVRDAFADFPPPNPVRRALRR